MENIILKAICEAITKGVLAKDSPLSVPEFEAIHRATLGRIAMAKRELAIQVVAYVKQDMKQQVEALAQRIP